MTVTIDLCINDEYGQTTGHCEYVNVWIGREQALEIACDIGFREPDARGRIKLGRRLFPASNRQHWVGNIFWDSFKVTPSTAAEIVNYLHERGGQVESGWSELFQQFIAFEPFAAAQFVQDARP